MPMQITAYTEAHKSDASFGTYRYMPYMVLGTVALLIFVLIVQATNGNLFWMIGGIIGLVAAAYGIARSVLRVKAYKRMQHTQRDLFAVDNKLRYVPIIRVAKNDTHYIGTIFKFGYNRFVEQQFTSPDDETIEIGNYACVTSYGGRSLTVHKYGYIRITLESRVGYGILDSTRKDISVTRLGRTQGATRQVDTRSPLWSDSRFALYAAPESVATVSALITPEVASFVSRDADCIAVEVIDSDVYIYSKEFDFNKPDTWQRVTAMIDEFKAAAKVS